MTSNPVVFLHCYFLCSSVLEKSAGSGIPKNPRTVLSPFQQQEFHAFEAQGFEFYPPTSAISLETKTALQFTLDLVLSYLVSHQ